MPLSRRTFLRRLGLASAAVAASSTISSCITPAEHTAEGDHDPSGSPFSEDQLGQMTLRTNPNTGDRVSILGYGMMRLPMKPGQNPQNSQGENPVDQEQVNRLVDFAYRHGVNYYDTSPAYCQGFSEIATGEALSRYPRHTYYIATKLSNFAPQTQTREASQQMFRNSLRYLKTDYIDYLLLHAIGGGGMDNFNRRFIDNGILDWLVEQKQRGVIRNLGFSFHGDIEVFETMLQWHDQGRYHWDFVQIQMNYLDWNNGNKQEARNVNAEYLYTELHRRGIPAVIMEPLLGGRLSKLPYHVIEHLKSRDPEHSTASWAFRFCGTYPGVLTALSGMTYMEHLEDNLRTYSPLHELSDEELQYLQETAELIRRYPLIPCNDCKYCMPCPYGLDIPGILLHYNKCVNEGTLPAGSQDPDYARLRRQYLISYDRAVPRQHQADHCIGCHICEAQCPQRIRIPQQMERINTFLEQLRRETLL